jgi:hypothetical protein
MHMKKRILNVFVKEKIVLDGLNHSSTLNFPMKKMLIITKDDTFTCLIDMI